MWQRWCGSLLDRLQNVKIELESTEFSFHINIHIPCITNIHTTSYNMYMALRDGGIFSSSVKSCTKLCQRTNNWPRPYTPDYEDDKAFAVFQRTAGLVGALGRCNGAGRSCFQWRGCDLPKVRASMNAGDEGRWRYVCQRWEEFEIQISMIRCDTHLIISS